MKSSGGRVGSAPEIASRNALAVTSKEFRLAISGVDPAQPPLLFIDVVLLKHGRAQVGLLFAGVVTPPARATEIALSRLVAQRVKVAMRGTS